jgi:hypothetical protein
MAAYRRCRAWAEAPYTYPIFLVLLIPLALGLDIHTTALWQQDLLGVGSFLILFFWTRFSPPVERRQVWIMVAVASSVEVWSSIVWGIYRYRFDNVPLFVPWGHGLVYLFALRMARTSLLRRRGQFAKWAALGVASAWAIFGLTLEPLLLHRLDVTGALFWPIFIWFMRKPSAPIFACAFFVTVFLELVGTHLGNWTWQVYAPVSHLPTGNPPSVISAGYCIMDFTSISIAAWLTKENWVTRLLPRLRPEPADSGG